MRAIHLYAAGIADAVLEGKESVPQVAVGEDEFVELDEAGNPRKKSPRGGRQRPQAAVRKKAPAARRRLPVAAQVPAVPGAEPVAAEDELENEVETDGEAAVVAAGSVPPPVAVVRRPAGGAGRGKGRGGARGSAE